MPYIATPDNIPGIRGLMNVRPDAALALDALVQALLVNESPLTRGERELIASFVSHRNDCTFCKTSHGAIAAHLPGVNQQLVQDVWRDHTAAPISDKLRSLLDIAAKVQQSGRAVTEGDIAAARALGASDLEIHDTVLIAATFCMFNRYVDGLGATTPDTQEFYDLIGRQRAAEGYLTTSVLMKPAP
ncbi:MAG: peroxidase-related enzyme [Gemmatimonas sp.]